MFLRASPRFLKRSAGVIKTDVSNFRSVNSYCFKDRLTSRMFTKSEPLTTYFRSISTTNYQRQLNQPVHPETLPRPGGIATMMRLPYQETADGLDACFVGVPMDIGTGYRSGTRFGPRHIRHESVILRAVNCSTGAEPFDSLQVADIGDVNLCMYDVQEACRNIEDQFQAIVDTGCKPLIMGGDHTITYPILKAIKNKYGPVGLIQVDAHPDTSDSITGHKILHSTPIRRALEDGCLIANKVVQIGLRGGGYSPDNFKWGKQQGFRVVRAEDCWHKSLVPLMGEIREMMGDSPVYLTFDIDGLDPSVAPGTGVIEQGGLTGIQGLEIIRGCKGLSLVGGDVTEICPQFDPTGRTCRLGADLLYELLCVLPGVKYHDL
ncbi:guanidinobutyrase [Patella vulgata]|uniref:guanidinobutyrase n=1 Tax=Patella vulgata TaxID=6465 RepID=UPI0024A9E913|nr:guanidinobutyrase [Patella vulgata]